MKIRTQMLIFILGVVLIGFVSVVWLSYTTSREMVQSEAYRHAETTVQQYVEYLSKIFDTAGKVATSMANAVRIDEEISERKIHRLLRENLKYNPELYGMTIFIDPKPEEIGKKLFAPYYYHRGEILDYVPAKPTFKFQDQPWYSEPKRLAQPVWTEPYYDAGAKTIMTTYSVPIYRNDQFIGLATVDIDLNKLSETINSIKIGETGYAILVSRNGTFLTHPDPDPYILKKKIQEIAKESEDPSLERLAEGMLKGENGALSIVDPFTDKRSWATYGVIPSTGYSLAIFTPERELLASVDRLRQNILLIGLTVTLLIVVGIIMISVKITTPIKKLTRSVQSITDGKLDEVIPESKSRSEVGILTQDIKKMVETIKKTIEEVNEEKEKFERVFTTMSDGIVATDPHWKVIKCNQSAEKMLELSEGMNLIQHISERFESSFKLEEIIDYKKREKHFELIRPETEQVKERIFTGVLNTIVDPNDNITAQVMTIRDVTEERKEEANKNNLLSMISHKLRTPITALLGISSLFEEGVLGELNEQQMQHIRSLSRQANKLNSLVDRLISYVTLTGQLDLAEEEIDLPSFLQDFKENALERTNGKAIQIELHLPEKMTPIRWNRQYLNLVFSELLDNAVKFNNSEEVKIRIAAKEDSQKWRVEFQDNGIGIPTIHQDKIFDRFFQVDKNFTGNQEGIGLGLSLVKSVVDQYHGSIRVESTEGAGSTFSLRFPKEAPPPEGSS